MVPVGKLRCLEKKMFQCQFVQHKFYVDYPGVTPLPPVDSPRTKYVKLVVL
jgi:hypothetical protein